MWKWSITTHNGVKDKFENFWFCIIYINLLFLQLFSAFSCTSNMYSLFLKMQNLSDKICLIPSIIGNLGIFPLISSVMSSVSTNVCFVGLACFVKVDFDFQSRLSQQPLFYIFWNLDIFSLISLSDIVSIQVQQFPSYKTTLTKGHPSYQNRFQML